MSKHISLDERVMQFKMLELPGQPMAMHMGTSQLVDDLWREVHRLQKDLDAANDFIDAIKGLSNGGSTDGE